MDPMSTSSAQRRQCEAILWWNTADELALFALVPPGQILFASDIPYGRTTAAALVLRAALVAGLTVEQIAIVAGGQLERLLAGAEPLDLGPAPTAPAPGPGPALKRVHTLLVAAAARLTTGYPGAEYVELARLACELPAGHANAAVARSIRDVIDRRVISGERCSARGPRAPGKRRSDCATRHLARVPPDLRRRRDRPNPEPANPRLRGMTR
jgi:hypothetical protein